MYFMHISGGGGIDKAGVLITTNGRLSLFRWHFLIFPSRVRILSPFFIRVIILFSWWPWPTLRESIRFWRNVICIANLKDYSHAILQRFVQKSSEWAVLSFFSINWQFKHYTNTTFPEVLTTSLPSRTRVIGSLSVPRGSSAIFSPIEPCFITP